MRVPPFKSTNYSSRRLIGALLFFVVFFLPLHFHPVNVAAQVAKECICLHGTLTQAGPASASANYLPALFSRPVTFAFRDEVGSVSILVLRSRAPPTLASL
jgi:hypothetical protein